MKKANAPNIDPQVIELPGGGKVRRDPIRQGYGGITCPDCREERYMHLPVGRKLIDSSGRCDGCTRTRKRRAGVQRHPSGATLLFDKRHPQDVEKVAFLCRDCCPSCESEHYTRWYEAQRQTWSGRCEDCRQKRRARVEELSSGARVRRDPDNTTRGWVTCPDCPEPKQERYLFIPSGANFEKFPGRCTGCSARRKRTLTGIVQHPSGATLLLDERDPADQRNRAAFECANAGQYPDCLAKSFGWLQLFKTPTWPGLCKHCMSNRPPLRKIADDLILMNGSGGTEGTRFLFSQEDDQEMVPVVYGGCGCTRRVLRQHIIQQYRKGTYWPKVCRECRNNPVRLIERLTHGARDKSFEQKTGNASKKQWGGDRRKVWTPDRSGEFLELYDEVYEKVKKKDPDLPEDVRYRLSLRGNKPADVALDYAAELFEIRPSSYLVRVLTEARREKMKTPYIQD
jgi:hypothetical protein